MCSIDPESQVFQTDHYKIKINKKISNNFFSLCYNVLTSQGRVNSWIFNKVTILGTTASPACCPRLNRGQGKTIFACPKRWLKGTNRAHSYQLVKSSHSYKSIHLNNLHIQIRLWSYMTCSVMMSFNPPKHLMEWQSPKLQQNYSCDKLYALAYIVDVIVMLRMYEHVTCTTDVRDSPCTWLGNPCPSGHELHPPAVQSDLEQTTKYNKRTGNT